MNNGNSVAGPLGSTSVWEPRPRTSAPSAGVEPAPEQVFAVTPPTRPEDHGRTAVRRIASGVAVLTVGADADVHGVTVSSLTAVSRDPLLVGLCLHRHSTCLGLLKEGRGFALNVLDTTQTTAARWFADPRRPRGRAQFDPVEWEPDQASGAPLIAGALAWMSCQLVASVGAGDHQLLLAEVTRGSAREGQPLLSFAGQVHQVTLTEVAPHRPTETPCGRRTVARPAR